MFSIMEMIPVLLKFWGMRVEKRYGGSHDEKMEKKMVSKDSVSICLFQQYL